MTTMTNSATPATSETASPWSQEPLHFSSKAGMWLLVGTMAILAIGLLKDVFAALAR